MNLLQILQVVRGPKKIMPPKTIIPEPQEIQGVLVSPRGTLEEMFPAVYSYLSPPASDEDIEHSQIEGDVNFEKLNILWVTPDFDLVSGGMRIVFELIHQLEAKGHKNTLRIFGQCHYADGEAAKKNILENYCQIDAEVILGIDEAPAADIIVCAGWQTAWATRYYLKARIKFFLVQDYEAHLYAMGSEHILCKQTLNLGFSGLALGPWVKKIMAEHGMHSTSFDFAIDSRYFYPRDQIPRKNDTVVFYARYVTPRRAFELGVVALNIVKKERPNTKIIMHGWITPSSSVPFEFIDMGIMNDEDRARLYCETTVGVALSLTNASMVPLEMMACKLPVVELKGDNTEVFYGEDYASFITLAEPHPRKIADAIIDLLDNPEKRTVLEEPAYEFVKARTWEKAGDVVEEALKQELRLKLQMSDQA